MLDGILTPTHHLEKKWGIQHLISLTNSAPKNKTRLLHTKGRIFSKLDWAVTRTIQPQAFWLKSGRKEVASEPLAPLQAKDFYLTTVVSFPWYICNQMIRKACFCDDQSTRSICPVTTNSSLPVDKGKTMCAVIGSSK